MTLNLRAFSAVRWTGAAMLTKSAFQLLQVLVLARLLTPADFGVLAIAMAILAMLQILSDAGISQALIHRRDLTDGQLSSLYWFNLSCGIGVALLLLACAPAAAYLLDMPELRSLMPWLCLVFPIQASSQQLKVMAERRLAFKPLAVIEIAAVVIGAATAILWAVWRPEPMAVVAGAIASALAATLLAWTLLADGWRPAARLKRRDLDGFLAFGGYTMATQAVNALITQLDLLIAGRLFGKDQVGLFSLPRDLTLRLAFVLNPILSRVALPVMAEVQADRERLQAIYLRSIWLTASVNFPLYAAMAAFAPELVLVMFGPQWTESASLLRVLAIWGMIRSIGNPSGSLIYATGRADLAFKWCLLALASTALVLGIAADWGTRGLAAGLLVNQLVLIVPGWLMIIRPLCGAGLAIYLGQVARPLVATSIATTAAMIIASTAEGTLARLALGLAAGAAGYAATTALVNRRFITEWRRLAAPLLGRR